MERLLLLIPIEPSSLGHARCDGRCRNSDITAIAVFLDVLENQGHPSAALSDAFRI